MNFPIPTPLPHSSSSQTILPHCHLNTLNLYLAKKFPFITTLSIYRWSVANAVTMVSDRCGWWPESELASNLPSGLFFATLDILLLAHEACPPDSLGDVLCTGQKCNGKRTYSEHDDNYQVRTPIITRILIWATSWCTKVK